MNIAEVRALQAVLNGSAICVCVCDKCVHHSRTVWLPYGFWTTNDALQNMVSDLLPIILMDVEGKDDLT